MTGTPVPLGSEEFHQAAARPGRRVLYDDVALLALILDVFAQRGRAITAEAMMAQLEARFGAANPRPQVDELIQVNHDRLPQRPGMPPDRPDGLVTTGWIARAYRIHQDTARWRATHRPGPGEPTYIVPVTWTADQRRWPLFHPQRLRYGLWPSHSPESIPGASF